MDKRKSYIDILRIIAMFTVMFNHTPGYNLYQNSTGFFRTWVYMSITMLTRVNWPLFLMISGALLLGKKDYRGGSTTGKVKKYAVLLIVYQMILLTLSRIRGRGPATAAGWILGILNNDFEGAFVPTWYLYAYLAFLIMLPYMRRIARDFDTYDFKLFIGLYCLLNTIFPMIRGLMNWNGIEGTLRLQENFELVLVTSRVFFWPLIGYYLENVLDMSSVKKKDIFLLSITAFFGILLSDTFCYIDGIKNGFSYTYNSLTCYVTAIWLFVVVKYFFYSRNKGLGDKPALLLQYAASLTFGIYLLDPLLKETSLKSFLDAHLSSLPVLIQSYVWCILSFIICGTATAILKKAPKVKEFL